MNNKKMIIGLLTLAFTGILAAFYWLDFFPSKYKIKLALMLAAWLFQTVGIVLFVRYLLVEVEGNAKLGIGH